MITNTYFLLYVDSPALSAEFRQRVGVFRCHAELELRVVDDLQQGGAVDLGLGHAQVGIGGCALVMLGELGRFSQGLDEGLVGLGVVVAEFLGGEQHRRRVGPQQVVGIEHHVHIRVLQGLVLEWRVGEVPGQLGAAGNQRGGGVWVGNGDGVLVQAIEFVRTIQKSLLISADNAHGVHPNYADKHDANHGPKLNAGPVIKVNSNQRYATNSETAGFFRHLCMAEEVPVQSFVVRSDMGCGSTIGPITASHLGVRTVDIGLPTFAMHSIRELCGSHDLAHLVKVLSAFYASHELP